MDFHREARDGERIAVDGVAVGARSRKRILRHDGGADFRPGDAVAGVRAGRHRRRGGYVQRAELYARQDGGRGAESVVGEAGRGGGDVGRAGEWADPGGGGGEYRYAGADECGGVACLRKVGFGG